MAHSNSHEIFVYLFTNLKPKFSWGSLHFLDDMGNALNSCDVWKIWGVTDTILCKPGSKLITFRFWSTTFMPVDIPRVYESDSSLYGNVTNGFIIMTICKPKSIVGSVCTAKEMGKDKKQFRTSQLSTKYFFITMGFN